jgi:beta-carotene hydroxylase
MKLLIHRSDALPASIITLATGLALLPLFAPLSTAALSGIFVLSVAGRLIAPVHQHCHAHRKLFRGRGWNDAYDFVLMLAAGNITAVWELQHVLGHHRLHLDPRRDPASVSRFTKEGPFQRIIFTVLGDLLSFTDSLLVARTCSHARARLPRLWRQQALQLVTLAVMLALDAKMAFVFFVAPNLVLRWFVFYMSYAQHHGAPGGDVYSGSVTRFGWSNLLFLNVGHHTAHHEKPTLHWTRLPDRTARILERIPVSCLRGSP